MKVVLLSLFVGLAGATELTSDTWDAAVAGKTVFVKFLAPWCGHCKSMKPAWDKLADAFKDSPSAVVADVDCTAGGKSLCEKVGVQGYPTIKHGNPDDLKDYEGGRTYDDLKKFADENLGPTCGPANLELCSDDDKATIERYMKMENAELDAALAEADAKIQKITDKHDKARTKVESKIKDEQAASEAATKKSDDASAKEKKKLGLGMMKAVLAARKKQEL